MTCPRATSAFQPVAPTTAAMAPNAPIGANHMTMAITRNTSRSRCLTPRRIASPRGPRACKAKPTSNATNSVCNTTPLVSAENRVVGMMLNRKSVVVSAAAAFA